MKLYPTKNKISVFYFINEFFKIQKYLLSIGKKFICNNM
jgi:hypothetical protein